MRQLKKVEAHVEADGRVCMPESLAKKGISSWKNTLVGVVLSRRLPMVVINRNVRRMWKDWGVLDVMSMGVRLVFVRFSNDTRFDQIIWKGDWNIVGCPFMVRRWTP